MVGPPARWLSTIHLEWLSSLEISGNEKVTDTVA